MSLSSIIAGALESALDAAGEDLVYRRGETDVPLRGIPGRTLFTGSDAERLLTQYEAHDWLVQPAALAIDLVPFLPESGDRITHPDSEDGIVRTFEVMQQGDQCYRLDPNSRLLRIYTKLIDQQPIA